MSKLLAYGLWMLLSLSSVSAIWCHDCETRSEKEKCHHKRKICWAGEGGNCYTQKLYIKNKVIFSRVGCFMGCTHFQKQAVFLWYTLSCCNQTYCNTYI